MHPVFALIAPIIISTFRFGTTGTNVITAFSLYNPLVHRVRCNFYVNKKKENPQNSGGSYFGNYWRYYRHCAVVAMIISKGRTDCVYATTKSQNQ